MLDAIRSVDLTDRAARIGWFIDAYASSTLDDRDAFWDAFWGALSEAVRDEHARRLAEMRWADDGGR